MFKPTTMLLPPQSKPASNIHNITHAAKVLHKGHPPKNRRSPRLPSRLHDARQKGVSYCPNIRFPYGNVIRGRAINTSCCSVSNQTRRGLCVSNERCHGGGDEKGRERACANSPLTPVGVGAGVGCDVQLLHIYAESGGTELLIRKHRNTNTKRDDTGFVETRSLCVRKSV